MEKNQKRLKELRKEYDDIMAGELKSALESGYGIDGGEYVPEFRDILEPAGFQVRQADKLETNGTDEYILKIVRRAS
jgi:hypothetical protein